MDDHERALLEKTVGGLLAATPAEDVPAALRDLGWSDVVDDDRPAALQLLFGQHGRTLCSANVFDDAILDPIGDDLPDGSVSVGYPDPGGPDTLLVFGPPGASIVAFREDGPVLAAASDCAFQPVSGIDPSLRTHRGRPEVATPLDCREWSRSMDLARLALATTITAVSAEMLSLAVEHVSTRRAFGRVLGEFQAVKQRLADAQIALLAASAAVSQGWADADASSAVMAKSLAGRAHATVATHGQQVLGGMGFTWEHRFHRYLRRGLALDAILGSADELARRMGAQIVSSGTVTRTPALQA